MNAKPMLAALAAAALGLAPGAVARAGTPALHLAWHAPHGAARASDTLTAACADTARADTLYLSFEAGGFRPRLLRVEAALYFHPVPGDTLGAFWFYGAGEPNLMGLFVDFAPFPDVACDVPWERAGEPDVDYDHRSGSGRLGLAYEIPEDLSVPLDAGRRYCFARVRILYKRAHLAGCAQPLCLHFAGARLAFATGRTAEIAGGPAPFATRNSRGEDACRALRAAPLFKPWAPAREPSR